MPLRRWPSSFRFPLLLVPLVFFLPPESTTVRVSYGTAPLTLTPVLNKQFLLLLSRFYFPGNFYRKAHASTNSRDTITVRAFKLGQRGTQKRCDVESVDVCELSGRQRHSISAGSQRASI